MNLPSSPKITVKYMDTALAYDLWSKVYDTDGNFLQALDTIEMEKLLLQMLNSIQTPKPWRVVDLGCGTGRNTILLLNHHQIEITALDLSPKMLEIARNRLYVQRDQSNDTTSLHFEVFDMLTAKTIPTMAQASDAIISTLVIEHVPLKDYFATAAKMLKSGGLLLLTNMHSEMGQISQAGFIDPKTGEKIRPTSYAHTTEEVVAEAAKHGFVISSPLEERTVTPDLAPRLGPRADKWVGVTVWFGGIFRKI